MTSELTLSRRAAAEFVGTAFLLAVVAGSGIMGERLAGGNAAVALLANSLATGAGLIALILTFGPVSGAHFNPIVTFVESVQGTRSWREAWAYVAAQFLGAIAGVFSAHIMFGLEILSWSRHERSGWGQSFSECVATLGLISVVHGCSRKAPRSAPYAVGAYITAAYWFTASTAFANPAVTLARTMTDTFSGIRLQDAPVFMAAQAAGAVAGTVLFRWMLSQPRYQPAAEERTPATAPIASANAGMQRRHP